MKRKATCVSYAILNRNTAGKAIGKIFTPSEVKNGKFCLYSIFDHFNDL